MNAELNTELKNKSLQVLQWVEETAKQTGNFVAEQTPLLIREILTYNFWWSFAWFALGCILFLYFCNCAYQIFFGKISKEKWEVAKSSYSSSPTREGLQGVAYIVSGIISLVVSLILMANNLVWIKVWLAPRVFLIEYVKDIIK